MENDWLKKVGGVSFDVRIGWVDGTEELFVIGQSVLAELPGAAMYLPPAAQVSQDTGAEDLLLCCLIDEEYASMPFYGSRCMVVFLRSAGQIVIRKRVQRLMRGMGLAGMAPGPNTSRAHPQRKIYPYLLRGVPATRSTDITYIRLARGLAYLVAVIEWYSPNLLSWRLSDSMDASFCVGCLDDALREHGKPVVFNSDQGSQFISKVFTDVLKRESLDIYLKYARDVIGDVDTLLA